MTDKLAASPVTLIRMAEVCSSAHNIGVPSVLMFNGDDSHEDTETSEVSGNDREYVGTPERLAPAAVPSRPSRQKTANFNI